VIAMSPSGHALTIPCPPETSALASLCGHLTYFRSVPKCEVPAIQGRSALALISDIPKKELATGSRRTKPIYKASRRS
jgi:hypothetical protein